MATNPWELLPITHEEEMGTSKGNETTVTLRWRASDPKAWASISENQRQSFRRSKGTKHPPVRGCEMSGYYYLDIYADGVRGTKRLGLRTTDDARSNNETERLALDVARNYQSEEWRIKHGFEVTNEERIPFVEFFRSNVPAGNKSWHGALLMLEAFSQSETPITDIDVRWLTDFKTYLLAARRENGRKLSQNTTSTYYSKIKRALQIAFEIDILPSNPATKIRAIPQVESKRVHLTIEELQRLADTPCPDRETKRAFLSSCYTGLRISDIKGLERRHVIDGRLEKIMKKPGEPIYLDLSPIAEKLITAIPNFDSLPLDAKLFNLPDERTMWVYIQVWARDAGIQKHVSYHVSRHTFATLMLSHTKDIYLVSKLLGHTSIQHTQIYAKIIDDRKREAMLTVPQIKVD